MPGMIAQPCQRARERCGPAVLRPGATIHTPKALPRAKRDALENDCQILVALIIPPPFVAQSGGGLTEIRKPGFITAWNQSHLPRSTVHGAVHESKDNYIVGVLGHDAPRFTATE